MGFFEAMQGQTQPFWFQPPGLSTLQNQLVGVGDGMTTSFPMQRTTGAFTEPLAGVASLSPARRWRLTPAAVWSLSGGYEPTLTLSTPPASGARWLSTASRSGSAASPTTRSISSNSRTGSLN